MISSDFGVFFAALRFNSVTTMKRPGTLLVLALVALPLLAAFDVAPRSFTSDPASAEVSAASLYYVVAREATLFRRSDGSLPVRSVSFRDQIHLIQNGDAMSLVRTDDGVEGYIRTDDISNVWIRVSKRRNEVRIYRGLDLLATFPADFGFNTFANKERRGSLASPDDWRTPEGAFYVVRKNPRSQYHRAFVLNYPTASDAERGYQQGLISQRERDTIVRAERRGEEPPMNTALGGLIEIHGHGTGGSDNWTQGCVAVRNLHMDLMWNLVDVGTPVYIES